MARPRVASLLRRSFAVGAVVLSCALLLPPAAAVAADDVAVSTTVSNDPGPVRLGYLPYWTVDTTAPADLVGLTHLAYHSVEATSAGELRWGTNEARWMASDRFAILRDAARAGGGKFLLNVARFGWGDVDRAETVTLLGDPEAQARLGAALQALIAAGQFDGIVLDLEPVPTGTADGHLALVRALRAALGPDVPLIVALTSNPASAHVAELVGPGAADYVHVMTYDYRTARSAYAGAVAPLEGSFSVSSTIAAFKAVAPADRLLLGVPYYGRVWSVESTEIGARTIPSSESGLSVESPSYARSHELAEEHGFVRDPLTGTAVVNYLREGVQRQLWFDDPVTITAKYRFALAQRLAGVGIWAIGYDDPNTRALRATLLAELEPDRTPPELTRFSATTPFSPNGDGRRDRSRIQATALGAATWRASVISPAGARVRAWSGVGNSLDVSWNGRTGSGSRVPDGLYRVRIRFVDGAGNTLTATREVRLDTVPPPLVVAVADLASGMRIRWRSNQQVTVIVTVRDTRGRIVWRGAPTVGSSGATLAPVRAGRYRVTISATDAAGNRRLRIIDTSIT